MTSTTPATPPLSDILLPSVPKEAYSFWFNHIPHAQNLTVPTPADQKPWFTRDQAFDQTCLSQFLPVLEAIRSSAATPDQILSFANPSTPTDWLGLVLLLDQLPRNCYRDAESAVVFTRFDPLALEIALRAINAGVPTSPALRYRLALRNWFYLPLMHSEDLHMQDRCHEEYRQMAQDVHLVLREGGDGGESPEEAECVRVLRENRAMAEQVCAQNLWFQKLHRDIIVRFGRYPHRNGALGRQSTPEEVRFLEEENKLG